MKPPSFQTGNILQNGSRPGEQGASAEGMAAQSQKTVADLIAMVEQALALADTLQLSLVGIDLSSALERLKDIREAERSREAGDDE